MAEGRRRPFSPPSPTSKSARQKSHVRAGQSPTRPRSRLSRRARACASRSPRQASAHHFFVATSAKKAKGILRGSVALVDAYRDRLNPSSSWTLRHRPGHNESSLKTCAASIRHLLPRWPQFGQTFAFQIPSMRAFVASVVFSHARPRKSLTTFNLGQIEGGTSVNSPFPHRSRAFKGPHPLRKRRRTPSAFETALAMYGPGVRDAMESRAIAPIQSRM